jgi:hypothetical protein
VKAENARHHINNAAAVLADLKTRAITTKTSLSNSTRTAMLRGGVKESLAVEPTQDAAIEKARKLEPDAAIHVERVRNVEGGGRDKWRRI